MITINDRTYSGSVITANEEMLTVVISTADTFQDVLANTLHVDQVADSETQAVYKVTDAVRANVIDKGTYYIVFSCKPSVLQEMENRILRQDSAIDDILVMLLGGQQNG